MIVEWTLLSAYYDSEGCFPKSFWKKRLKQTNLVQRSTWNSDVLTTIYFETLLAQQFGLTLLQKTVWLETEREQTERSMFQHPAVNSRPTWDILIDLAKRSVMKPTANISIRKIKKKIKIQASTAILIVGLNKVTYRSRNKVL